MHKHRTNSKSGRGRRRNANVRVPESVSDFIAGLLTELGDNEDYFASLYLKSQYLSKYCDERLTPAETRRQKAIAKWLATELVNGATNHTLVNRDPGYNILPRVTWSSFLKFARRLISDVLGPLDDTIVLGSYSGGASTSLKRNEASPAKKFARDMADTNGSCGYAVDIIYRLAPLLRRHGTFDSLREVKGAVLFTVPKKTDIDRCACKEPDFNMFLQKGAGAHIRRRLRRFGVQLNDQSINRRLAQVGASSGELATLDLSSASDTITIECVKQLLPNDWFLYLNDIRSQFVMVGGGIIRTEMFSSMGNGFTFELESLIFWALARTTLYFEGIPGIVSVYGDDIVCPSQGYAMISWVLESFGFRVNPEKSFHTGPFRESCGGHYHGLEDVTPFYLKRKATRLTDVIRVANQLRRWALADPSREFMMPSTYKVWTQLASFVPRSLWGGYDLAIDTQLVSPHLPKRQLVRRSEKRDDPEVGRYLLWHNSSWKRTTVDEVSHDAVDTSNWCDLRRVRKGAPYPIPLFHEEVLDHLGRE